MVGRDHVGLLRGNALFGLACSSPSGSVPGLRKSAKALTPERSEGDESRETRDECNYIEFFFSCSVDRALCSPPDNVTQTLVPKTKTVD